MAIMSFSYLLINSLLIIITQLTLLMSAVWALLSIHGDKVYVCHLWESNTVPMPHVQDESLNHCSVGAGGLPYSNVPIFDGIVNVPIFNVKNIEHEIKHPEKTPPFFTCRKVFFFGHWTYIYTYLK